MARPWGSDLIGVIKGFQSVANALLKHQEKSLKRVIVNSSIKSSAEQSLREITEQIQKIDPSKVPEKLVTETRDFLERVCVVEKGISEYSKHQLKNIFNLPDKESDGNISRVAKLQVNHPGKDPKEILEKKMTYIVETKENSGGEIPVTYSSVKEKIEKIGEFDDETVLKIQLSDKDKKLLRQLELEHEKKISEELKTSRESIAQLSNQKDEFKIRENQLKLPKVVIKPRVTLSAEARERKVPSTRIQRMVSFGTLGIGLGIGTLAEYGRRTFGFKDSSVGDTLDSMFLTKANAERIVATLCKVRGAALKIGQILSIQDNNVISPELQKAFERVRQSADFMPTWQVQKVMDMQLGLSWRSKVSNFEEKPFAAASIGQVHLANLPNGQAVAVKIQYPGIADGIQSDIDNLVGILKVWNIFPEGMFIDNVVEVAKRELSWEVDYIREAECSKKFKQLLEPYPEYYVPTVIDNLCSKQVFTSELVDGIPVDKCVDMDLETREHICKLIMQLCLKELFVFRYMQTDPNWANFFYNSATRQMVLLDFGASREYSKEFMDQYIEIIYAASRGDRDKVLIMSREMKFLTGYESKLMENAHVDAVMTLGEVFSEKIDKYDFGGQNVTKSMRKLVPTIISHRLCPPPEEIYSLHRKLSGVFLLCAKLNVNINCREMFYDIYQNYKFS